MGYPQAIRYLESFVNYEEIPAYPYKESLKLERVKEFLDRIGKPQKNLKCLHVAGTKGKGSSCAFLAFILRQAGYKTGLYTSPHLIDFRERIRTLNALRPPHKAQGDFEGMITRGKFAELVETLRPAVEEYNKGSKYGPLTFFEVCTAIALFYFKEKKVDFAVLETGLGGRLDATNVAEPLVCAITSISYEHTQKLGNTLGKIAAEKAGIIKRYALCAMRYAPIVISAPQEKEARDIIVNKCKEVGAKLYIVGKDIKYKKNKTGFDIHGPFGEYKNLKISLIGGHQIVNAATAIGMIEALRNHGILIDADSIKKGLYNTVWPGRCEVISRNPIIVLDGAQNTASAAVIGKAIRQNFKYKRLVLVLGISSDKDIKGICKELKGLADTVILTKSKNPRATPHKELAQYFRGGDIHITDNVAQAKKTALSISGKEDLILVTGSLFVAGEFRDAKA